MNIKKAWSVGLVALVILLAIVLAGAYLTNKKVGIVPVNNEVTLSDETADWKTYKNEKYGFELNVPINWLIEESKTQSGVKYISINNKKSYITLYPEGYSTELSSGPIATSTVKFKEPTEKSFDYVLDDGTSYGVFVNFSTPPSSWNRYGWIAGRVEVKDLKYTCLNGSKMIEGIDCVGIDTEHTNTSVTGSVNIQDREVMVKILESFKFTK